jgi:hypothetical protein
VAINFRSSTRSFGRWNAVDGEGIMPHGRYLGFMLGPESILGRVEVEAGDTIVLSPGAIVPVPPWVGTPMVRCRSKQPISAQLPALVHVIGLTECYELALPAAARAPFDAILTGDLPAGNPGWFHLPFGRRHALLSAYATGSGDASLSIWGVNSGIALEHEIALAGPVAFSEAGLMTGYHIGGTDHEEPWEYLKVGVTQTTAGSCELHYRAFGEPGG